MSKNKLTTTILVILALVMLLAGAFEPFDGIQRGRVITASIAYFIFALVTLGAKVRLFLLVTLVGWTALLYRIAVTGVTDQLSLAVVFCWGITYLMATQTGRREFWPAILAGSSLLLVEQAVFAINLWPVIAGFIFLLLMAQNVERVALRPAAVLMAIFIALPLPVLIAAPQFVDKMPPVTMEQVVTYDGGRQYLLDSTDNAAEQPLFVVKADTANYWRGKVFDYFDGRQWVSNLEQGELTPQFSGRGKKVTQEITLFADAHFLPAAYQVESIQAGEFTADSAGSVLKVVEAPFSYSVVSEVPTLVDQQGRWAEEAIDRERYLQLPDNLSPGVTQLADEVSGTGTNWEKAQRISNYLKNTYQYNTQVEFSDADMVAEFLFKKKEGYCVQFANAMVIMARSVGIPARWVLGFTAGVYDKQQQAYYVYGSNAHTWAEIFVPDSGWLPVEATPGFSIPGLTTEEDTATNQVGGAWKNYKQPAAYLLSGLLLLLTMVTLVRITRGRRLGKQTGHGYQSTLYGEIVSWCAGNQIMPRRDETPLEFAGRIGQTTPDITDLVKQAAEDFSAWRYGRKAIDSLRQQELREKWQHWRRNSTKK